MFTKDILLGILLALLAALALAAVALGADILCHILLNAIDCKVWGCDQ